MLAECFNLTFTEDATLRMHVRHVGDLDGLVDWQALVALQLAPEFRRHAQDLWAFRAYTEFCSAPLLAQLGQSMAACSAPVNLVGVAFQLCAQELRHAELCGRVAAALGAVSHQPMLREDMHAATNPALSPRQVANNLALQLCGIGETLSLRQLQALCRMCSNSQIKAVLQSIVKDEAVHSRLGWLYLEWASASFDETECRRLAAVAEDCLRHAQTRYSVPNLVPTEVLHAYGDISQSERLAAYDLALHHDILPRLAILGLSFRTQAR